MSKARVLYSFCGTGQGHMSKAKSMESELRKRYDVDFLVSSLCNPLLIDVDYIMDGATLTFEDGKLDIPTTFNNINAKKYLKDCLSLDLSKYDFIINDHETLVASASYIREYENIFTLSHQAAFRFKETPRFELPWNRAHEKIPNDLVMRGYSTNKLERCYGIHYKRYHERIFYPLLREEILNMNPTQNGKCVVYMPKLSKEQISSILSSFKKQEFIVFDPKMTSLEEKHDNILFRKTDNKVFLENLEKCSMAIINAGFEMPSELMYLGKKFIAIPQEAQYEQECNALALSELGVKTYPYLTKEAVRNLLSDDTAIYGQPISSPAEILDIIEKQVK